VGLVSLAINLSVPTAVVLLEIAQAAKNPSRHSATPSTSQESRPAGDPVKKGILAGLSSPLLWAPVFGVLVVLFGLRLPPIVKDSFTFIGFATSGVAVFAVGLTLAAHQLTISRTVIFGTLGRITIQTSVVFFGSVLAHLSGPFVREAIVCCSFPLSTVTVLMSAKYGDAESETASMLCLSTLSLVFTVPLALRLSR